MSNYKQWLQYFQDSMKDIENDEDNNLSSFLSLLKACIDDALNDEPCPYKRKGEEDITIELDEDVKNVVYSMAEEYGMAISDYIEMILKKKFEERD